MAIIKNDLETEEDVQDYKDWLASKGIGRLRSFRKIYVFDQKTGENKYKNKDLRIQLVDEEIARRLH